MVGQITIPRSGALLPASPSTFASQPSFSQKILNFALTLAQNSQTSQPNSFAESQGSAEPGTYNLSGFRSRCRITYAGAPAGSQADIAIWGLPQSLMNQFATLGVVVDSVSKNTILVGAGAASGDDASAANASGAPPAGFPVVFGGTIWWAWGDYGSMPEVPFRIIAQAGMFAAVQAAKPASFTGSTSIEQIMQGFASALGVPLENNGVSGTLSNPYFPGTLLQQVYQAAYHANINAQLVDGGTKLAIWPAGGSRTSQSNIPLVSPETGMIGYPRFANNGWLVVEMVYNPNVLQGGNIQVESSIQQANRTWTVYKIDLALDSLFPGGDWKATVWCTPQGVSAGAPPAA